MPQDEKGVMREGGPLIAWFKDPAGNTLSVLQESRRCSACRWARLVSNQRPLACEASALPLSYAPGRARILRGSRRSVGAGVERLEGRPLVEHWSRKLGKRVENFK